LVAKKKYRKTDAQEQTEITERSSLFPLFAPVQIRWFASKESMEESEISIQCSACPDGKITRVKVAKSTFKSLIKEKPALCISAAYGFAALLLYGLGYLGGGDGPIGGWYLVFFSALPTSGLFNLGVCYLDRLVPDSIFGLLYAASPIVAGMLQVYLLSRGFFVIRRITRGARTTSK
jgi:hypothetical protein